jgi:cyclase
MLSPRIIPCLLYHQGGLVKTVRFRNPVYLGDPINTARIFNDSGADELIFLDIRASLEGRPPALDVIAGVASECFMPLAYGGGLSSADQARAILSAGAEKVVLNTAAAEDPPLIGQCAERFGKQAVVVSIDVMVGASRRPELFVRGGTRGTGLDPVAFAVEAERLGAGEILVNSIDRDGTMTGYDLATIRAVAAAVNIPVIACGGAGSLGHLRAAVLEGGASAAAAGSLFVFHGPHRAVLISYPDKQEAEGLFR